METARKAFGDDLRATFRVSDADLLDLAGYEEESDTLEGEALPPAIGQDERRMQVRAYNHWSHLLGDHRFPLVSSLHPADNDDFGPNSVTLNFAAGIDNPLISFIGRQLAEECGVAGPGTITQLSDVPSHSLLSRITDHYIQILANQAPIGFEAEFVNRHRRMVLYRGILLPFSRDGNQIDHIYGVLNWKELADGEILRGLRQELEVAADTTSNAPAVGDTPLDRMRAMSGVNIESLDDFGPEYTLLLARRDRDGRLGVLGEVPYDRILLDRAARDVFSAVGTKQGCHR